LVLVKPEEVTENDTPVVQVKWDGEEYVICKKSIASGRCVV